MPQFDQTGSINRGPLTEWGFGPCAMGLGIKRGFERCFNWSWPRSVADRKRALADYKKLLRRSLKMLKDRQRTLRNRQKFINI